MDTVEEKLGAFLGVCRKAGLKATHQRREIYREIARTDEHPDAEVVFRRVRRRMPAVSLDTVYRTLRLLEEKGVILRVGSPGDRTRFDANTAPHCHFVCTRCGAFMDVRCGDVEGCRRLREMAGDRAVQSIYIELRGLCPKCGSAGTASRRRWSLARVLR